jgi:glucose/galactose transporter
MTLTDSFNRFMPMITIGALFFIFGFVTWLNGALIPFLQMVMQLSETQALFVAFSFYIAYVVMALPMSWILDRTGYKKGMVIGLLLIAVGAFLFIPAALSKQFAVFLFAQFVMGSGLTILQTASNPYIVRMGPDESAAARIAVMGVLNKAAGVLAPIVFTALVLGQFSDMHSASLSAMPDIEREAKISLLAQGLMTPYLGMGLMLGVLALALHYSSLEDLRSDEDPAAELSANEAQSTQSIVQYPQLILGAIALFFYVGAEVIAGDTIGLYGSKLGILNATALTSLTMLAMVLGYLLGLACIPRWFSQQQALVISAMAGIGLSSVIVLVSPEATYLSGVWFWSGYQDLPDVITYIALLGLANAMVWPAIWPLALQGLGQLTATGSAILIMGIAGGAILPLVYGMISDHTSNQTAYLLLLPCYGFILFYGVVGYKMRGWRQKV